MENILKTSLFTMAFINLFVMPIIAHEGGSNEHSIVGESSGFTGSIELRPSLESGSGNMFGDNIFELGYRINERLAVGYQQEFHHNIALKEENPEHEGLGLHLEEGFLNAHLHGIWESQDERSTLSLEPRIHLPTSSEEREKGFQMAALSYLKFKRGLDETTSVSVMDAPVFFFYSIPGASVGEEFEANPTFQNRLRVALDLSFFERKVSVTWPVLFYLTRHADFDVEALHNDVWTKFIGLAPEINYALTDNLSAGLAIISPNLLDSQDVDHSVNHARTNTLTQMILRAQL